MEPDINSKILYDLLERIESNIRYYHENHTFTYGITNTVTLDFTIIRKFSYQKAIKFEISQQIKNTHELLIQGEFIVDNQLRVASLYEFYLYPSYFTQVQEKSLETFKAVQIERVIMILLYWYIRNEV